jgi:penicillin amidase
MERMIWPQSQVMIDTILNSPGSEFFDDKSTPERETLEVVVRKAFAEACAGLEKDFGPPGASWAWGRVKDTRFDHLGRLPGLGRETFPTDGASTTINAIAHGWGPSWRMVVELGPEVRAWGIYPGGQSGNPGSKHYDEFIDDWAAGRPYELVFLKSADELNPSVEARTFLGGVK